MTTTICVQSTVREAADRGFWTLVLDDGCAAMTPELHQSSLEALAFRGMLAQVTGAADFLKALEKAASHPATLGT